MKQLHRVLKPRNVDKISYWYKQQTVDKSRFDLLTEILEWFLTQFNKYTIAIPVKTHNEKSKLYMKIAKDNKSLEIFTQLDVINSVDDLLTEIQRQLDNLLDLQIDPSFVPVKLLFDYTDSQYVGFVDQNKIFWLNFRRQDLSVVIESVQEITTNSPYYTRKGLIWKTHDPYLDTIMCLILTMLRDGYNFIASDTVECVLDIDSDQAELVKVVDSFTDTTNHVKYSVYPSRKYNVHIELTPASVEIIPETGRFSLGKFFKDFTAVPQNQHTDILLQRIQDAYKRIVNSIREFTSDTIKLHKRSRSTQIYVNPENLKTFTERYERWAMITSFEFDVEFDPTQDPDSKVIGPCYVYDPLTGWVNFQYACLVDSYIVPPFLVVFTPRRAELPDLIARIIDQEQLKRYKTWLVFSLKHKKHADRFRKALGEEHVIVIESVKEYNRLLGHEQSVDFDTDDLTYDYYVLSKHCNINGKKPVFWVVPRENQTTELAELIRHRKTIDNYPELIECLNLTPVLSSETCSINIKHSKPGEIRKVLKQNPERVILSLEKLLEVLGHTVEKSLLLNNTFYQFVTTTHISAIIIFDCKSLTKQEIFDFASNFYKTTNTLSKLIDQYLNIEQKPVVVVFVVDKDHFLEPIVQLRSPKTISIFHPGSEQVITALIRNLSPAWFIPSTSCSVDNLERALLDWLSFAFDSDNLLRQLVIKLLFSGALDRLLSTQS